MEWKLSSLAPWFLFLLWLNLLDILVTNPAFESNPFTLAMWRNIGFFLSAWIKICQVLLFGLLCTLIKKVAGPTEWLFARKLLLGTLIALVAFYLFVVAWNIAIYISLSL